MDPGFVSQMSCICVGPKRAGKTHLLKALENPESIDETTYSMPTNGTNIFTINIPTKLSTATNSTSKTEQTADKDCKDAADAAGSKRKKPPLKCIRILEIGGAMAPLWRQYYGNVSKLIYVVDTSNLCQISAAGVLLYSILAEPRLQRCRILLVLAKMDYAYRQMRNEALLMLQISINRTQTLLTDFKKKGSYHLAGIHNFGPREPFSILLFIPFMSMKWYYNFGPMFKLQKEVRQELTIVEASAVSHLGFDAIYAWLQIP